MNELPKALLKQPEELPEQLLEGKNNIRIAKITKNQE